MYGLIFVFISLLVFSPWLARNFNLTGNPLYPLYSELSSLVTETVPLVDGNRATKQGESDLSPELQVAKESQKKLGPLLLRKFLYQESLPYTLMIPLRIFYEGQDDAPRYFDGRLNFLLLALPLLLLLLNKKGDFSRELAFFGVFVMLVLLLTLFSTDMRIRYVAAIIPPLVVLSTYSLYSIREKLTQWGLSGRLVGSLLVIIVMAYFFPNLRYAYELFHKIDPLPHLSGEIDRSTYIAKHRPEYAAISAANDLVPAKGKLLAMHFGNRRYYFSVDTKLKDNIFSGFGEKPASSQALYEQLTKEGTTHLILNEYFFNQWESRQEQAVRELIQQFFVMYAKKIYRGGGYAFYSLEPGG